MTPYRNKIILLVFLIQLLIPLSCIALVCTVLAMGQEVTVQMTAYDPYDMIRGRYLQIRNPDSEVTLESGLEDELEHLQAAGKKLPDIYVVLEPGADAGLSRFSYATLKRPNQEIPYIKCSASAYSVWNYTDETTLHIFPGIDKYYLNESDANYLDQYIQWDTDIRVKLKLWNGMYAVDGIIVDGIPY